MKTKTLYFDLETGGVKDEPVIQLAAIAVNEDWSEAGTFEQKLKFDPDECDPAALTINGWTQEAWKNAVDQAKCVRLFTEFVRQHSTIEMTSKVTGRPYKVAKLAGYNALTFDLPRLRALYGQAFFPCSYHVRDVLQRVLFYFDEHMEIDRPNSLKLSVVCGFFGIAADGAHEALSDVRMTIALHRRLAGG